MSAIACLIILAASGTTFDPSPSEQSPEGSNEIVVTGERIRRSLRETPSSVVVFTAGDIDKLTGADRLGDLLELVPNVQTGGRGPAIRGQDSTGALQDLPAFLGGNRPRVTLQVDGRAVGYNEFIFGVAPLWDVARVEVFRGPQTTTQGRNAIAGAIFVQTNDPSFDWEVRGRAIMGNFETRQASAAITGPLIDNQLAFRLAADVQRSRPASDVANSVVGANPNHDKYGTARFKLLATPASLPGVRFAASLAHLESQLPGGETVVPPFRKRHGSFSTAVFRTNVDSLTTNLAAPLGSDVQINSTLTTGLAKIRRFAPVGLGQTRIKLRDFSLETIVQWRPSERMHGHGGVYVLGTKLDQFINLSAVLGLGEFRDEQRSLGLFGETTFRPLPKLSIMAGLRRQQDRQDRHGALGTPTFPGTIDFDKTYRAWLPRLSIAYDLAPKVTAGILIQRGFNPGGITLNFDTAEQDEFGAETLWSYELFTRSTFAGGRLRFNANIFHNDFQNAQRTRNRAYTVPGGRTAFWAEIDNVPKSDSEGLEAEVDWQATSRLRLRGGVGLLRTKILKSTAANPAIEGKQFQRAPSFTGSASVDWQPNDRLRLNAAIRHHSSYFSDDVNSAALRIGPATIADARADYDAGPFGLFGYARNLFDNFEMTYLFSPTLGTVAEPREIGVGIEMRF